MFVEWTPVTGEVQLLMNIDILISEDLRPGCSGNTERYGTLGDHLQTTPRSATSSDLITRNLFKNISLDGGETPGMDSQFILLGV